MTLRRFELVPLVGTGDTGLDADGNVIGPEDPIRPNIPGSASMLGQFGTMALVKRLVPDGTAQTPGTLADLAADGLDVNAAPLGPAARATIKTWLTNQGIDVGQFDADGVDDRRKLLRFILRRVLGWSVANFRDAFTAFDAAG